MPASESTSVGRLFVVATPIGNLGDMTLRAIETLKAVRFIVCEDTRHSRTLLERHGIEAELVSLPAFAEADRVARLVERLAAGVDAALITDAGTPAISDPGEKLVAHAIERGVTVIPIPGPSAVIAALCASGLPTGRFHFLGFLPRQESEANAMLDEVRGLSATLVFYEAPGRVGATLRRLHDVLGDRRACVARELTKVHETFDRGALADMANRYETAEVLGEVVLLVEGRAAAARWSESEVVAALEAGLARGERLKSLATDLAKRADWPSQDIYRLGVGLKRQS